MAAEKPRKYVIELRHGNLVGVTEEKDLMAAVVAAQSLRRKAATSGCRITVRAA